MPLETVEAYNVRKKKENETKLDPKRTGVMCECKEELFWNTVPHTANLGPHAAMCRKCRKIFSLET